MDTNQQKPLRHAVAHVRNEPPTAADYEVPSLIVDKQHLRAEQVAESRVPQRPTRCRSVSAAGLITCVTASASFKLGAGLAPSANERERQPFCQLRFVLTIGGEVMNTGRCGCDRSKTLKRAPDQTAAWLAPSKSTLCSWRRSPTSGDISAIITPT